jgi:hypothetical protein
LVEQLADCRHAVPVLAVVIAQTFALAEVVAAGLRGARKLDEL